jgi:hypothetical protein
MKGRGDSVLKSTDWRDGSRGVRDAFGTIQIMNKILLAVCLALSVPVNAGQGSITRQLMDETVSMLDIGIYRLNHWFSEMNLGTQWQPWGAGRRVYYDPDYDRIVIEAWLQFEDQVLDTTLQTMGVNTDYICLDHLRTLRFMISIQKNGKRVEPPLKDKSNEYLPVDDAYQFFDHAGRDRWKREDFRTAIANKIDIKVTIASSRWSDDIAGTHKIESRCEIPALGKPLTFND